MNIGRRWMSGLRLSIQLLNLQKSRCKISLRHCSSFPCQQRNHAPYQPSYKEQRSSIPWPSQAPSQDPSANTSLSHGLRKHRCQNVLSPSHFSRTFPVSNLWWQTYHTLLNPNQRPVTPTPTISPAAATPAAPIPSTPTP